MNYWTYILQSIKFDKYYIGQSGDVDDRFRRHNNGESKSTKAYRPWKLVYRKRWNTRSEAVQHEKQLKSFKNKKYLEQSISYCIVRK